MRPITTHHINPCNEAIRIEALGEPGPGGAHRAYKLEIWGVPPPNVLTAPGQRVCLEEMVFHFQNGPVDIDGNGVNGITHEALLAVLIDRLQGFQAGPYACPENSAVLAHLQAAVAILAARTKRRDEAGIEGTLALDPVETRSGGQIAYEAYAGSTGWKSAISGLPLPPWKDQHGAVSAAWEAAASAVVVAAVKLGSRPASMDPTPLLMAPEVISAAARAAHEVNRIWCRLGGDISQAHWEDAPDWQQASAHTGADAINKVPSTTPQQSHEGWMRQKQADGWVYGPTKDPVAKTHPCMVPYEQLPPAQRAKDHLFGATVRAIFAAAALGA